MKALRVILVLSTVFSLALFAGLAARSSQAADERTTTVLDVEPFDEIHLRGAGNVVIEIGDDSRVEITAPETIARLFTSSVEDGELTIGFSASVGFDMLPHGGIDYLIVTPTLTDLDLTGPVTATLDGLVAREFDLDLSGVATATLTNIDVADLEVDLDLASVATISGSAGTQDIEADNASTYDGAYLESNSATVDLETASNATVRVIESLSGTVRTAAVLSYITENATITVETATAGTAIALPYAPLEGAAAAATPEGTPAAIAEPQTWQVEIAQFTFTPATLEIHVGDTVTWTNKDNFPHDVSQLPKGSGFASPQFGKGQTFSVTFDKPGTYDYFCALHPIMLGSITVVE
jgi:amicyanin